MRYTNYNHIDSEAIFQKIVTVTLKGDRETVYHVKNNMVYLLTENIIKNPEQSDDVQTQDDCFVYDNWCGPGCSGSSDPVDSVDACCKERDICYGENGYFDCQCDADLINCLEGESGFIAWAVRTYFLAQAGFNLCEEIVE